MMSDTIPAVDYQRAHGTRAVLLSVHKVIGDYSPIRRCEQLAEADRSNRRIARVQIRRPLLEYVVLDRSALGKAPAQLGDTLPLPHQLDFRPAQLLSFSEIFVWLVR